MPVVAEADDSVAFEGARKALRPLSHACSVCVGGVWGWGGGWLTQSAQEWVGCKGDEGQVSSRAGEQTHRCKCSIKTGKSREGAIANLSPRINTCT